MNEPEPMVEVFRAGDEALAQMAVDEVLRPAGFEVQIRNRASRMIPAPGAMVGGFYLAVPASQAERAVKVLREAHEDGALPEEGEVLTL